MYATYIQNNSGGSFIGIKVIIIEADSLEEADSIAESHGIYFDGVDTGADCECCGDRWRRAYDMTNIPEYWGLSLDYQKNNYYNGFFMCDDDGERLILIVPKK
jgi:hypothetical protein